LSDNEFAELLGGNISQTVMAHLQSCPECGLEVREVREAVIGFRQMLGAAAAPAPRTMVPGATHSLHHFGLRLVGAVAVLLMVSGAILLDRNSHATVPNRVEISDAELLNEVQAQLTSDSPAALEPANYLAEERQEILQDTKTDRDNQRRQ
jgi:hypothetical protein